MILYIDPGTGSMLFTILIGLIGTAFYAFRMMLIKIKFKMSGGKAEYSDEKIPFAIFSDDKRYWNIFEPICREFEKRGKDIVYMTASEDDPALNCEFKHVKAQFIGDGNKAFAKLNFLKANILFSTTPGLDVYQWKRSKEVDYYVHIAHAANDITLYRMFGIDYYDAILLSGEYQANNIRQLEEIRKLDSEISSLLIKQNSLVDLRLDNKIDEKIYEDKYVSLQNKYLEKSKEKESLEFNLKNENNIKKRMKEFKDMLERNEILKEFDRFVFESIVDKVIVGEIDENENVDPYKLRFVYKTGFTDNIDGSKFKAPRKNEKSKHQNDGEESNKLCSHSSNKVNKLCSYSSDNTC